MEYVVAEANGVEAGVGRERIAWRDILKLLINEMLATGCYEVDG